MFYHYINRLANALLGETPLLSKRTRLKSPLKRIATRIFLDAVNRPKDNGESLSLLPKADLPNELGWARTSATVAQAYASFASAVEEAGELALPTEVRAYLTEELGK